MITINWFWGFNQEVRRVPSTEVQKGFAGMTELNGIKAEKVGAKTG